MAKRIDYDFQIRFVFKELEDLVKEEKEKLKTAKNTGQKMKREDYFELQKSVSNILLHFAWVLAG